MAQARNLKLSSGELVIERGNLLLVSGLDAIRQSVECRLRTFRGEWFLDEDVGVPYFEHVLVKNPNPALVRNTIREELLAVPGVKDVVSVDLTLQPGERNVEIAFRVTTDLGELEGSV